MEAQTCPICFEPYDDQVQDRRCYTICANEGHAVCKDCIKHRYSSCPICRGGLLDYPVFTRGFKPVDSNRSTSREQTNQMDVDAEIQQENEDIPEFVNKNAPLVFIIDISGSMDGSSGEQTDAPKRIELAVHISKIFVAFAKKLGVDIFLYTFSSGCERLSITKNSTTDEINRVLENLRPCGETRLGNAMKVTFQNHGNTAKYFIFTDGEPTDHYREEIGKFDNTQVHLIAFSNGTKVDLLKDFGTNSLHTISYVEDVRSLPGYMVPVFIYAITDMKKANLSIEDDECRRKYVQILEPQIDGNTSQYRISDLIELLVRYNTPYSRDLKDDTDGNAAHGRIEYSIKRENWQKFGKYYLQHINHCHKYMIPGNSFDPSLKHYRTPEYVKIYNLIADIPSKISFIPFMSHSYQRAQSSGNTVAAAQVAAASATRVTQSFRYTDSYNDSCSSYNSYSASDDGCIGPDALIPIKRDNVEIVVPMRDIFPGDYVGGSRIKWILVLHNLCNNNSFSLYNGVTGSHPVKYKNMWMKAKNVPDAKVEIIKGIVYDVIVEDRNQDSMLVNGNPVAVVGYPVPGMVHPYWGSNLILDDVVKHCPDGGFIHIDTINFKYDETGAVSSIF